MNFGGEHSSTHDFSDYVSVGHYLSLDHCSNLLTYFYFTLKPFHSVFSTTVGRLIFLNICHVPLFSLVTSIALRQKSELPSMAYKILIIWFSRNSSCATLPYYFSSKLVFKIFFQAIQLAKLLAPSRPLRVTVPSSEVSSFSHFA